MKHAKAPFLAWLPGLLLWGCGPQIELETAEDDSGGATTSDPPSTTGGTIPPMTSVGPTSPPDTGPVDTGLDTGEPWLDLPEWCSVIEQDCPEGFKCMPWSSDGSNSWNDTKCVPIVPDPNAPGEPCMVEGSGVSGIDDCDGISMCWDVDPETNEGTCVPFCIGTEQEPFCADRCNYCTISGDGLITLCLSSCDPIAQDCAPGQACYPVNDQFICAPDASPEGTGIGSPCEFINVCPPGLVCLNAAAVPGCDGGIGCCAPVCPAGGADPCPGLLPGTECVPWYPDGIPPGIGCFSTEPGACVIPE
ncbi:MAG: hypothetical protein H6712_35155 [Myxococcales bacterium]|nr:hypothetical protein [Myxococcales bacterium]MCB9719137.1 hypothetical protein [Myxococcales bacterium]